MLLQNKQIAIVGGGPGGLTLARLLQLKGVDVKVYERDLNKDVRVQGGSLDLHAESGLAALQKAGLMEEFKSNYRPKAELIRIVDNQAKIYSDEHTKEPALKFGDKNYRPEIDRGPLRTILLNSLAPNTVVWNSHILSIEKKQDSWKLVFENGSSIVADIVIGADGANSKIRPFVTNSKPFYSGITAIEGVITDSKNTTPHLHELVNGGKIFAFGNSKTLIVSSKDDGGLSFYPSFSANEYWVKNSGINFNDKQQVLAWFKKDFAQWSSVWYELFDNDNVYFITRPLYCMPLDQKWESKSNITLLGDAAHLMAPFAGEGVNMAMLDALQLSEVLTNTAFASTQLAIASYEKQMLSRFKTIGQGTLFNTKWMHQPSALNDMLSMFSNNIFKQAFFLCKMTVAIVLIPFLHRIIGTKAPQKTVV